MNPHNTAVSRLTSLGLSTYAARTLVGLVRLGTGTARDVSRVIDVPRSRVYDAADELQEAGLIDVMGSSPKQFTPVSAETTGRIFQRLFQDRTETLQAALTELEPAASQAEQRGVWTVSGRAAVTDRVIEFVESADEEVVYMSVGELLTEEVVAALEGAADRGADVAVGDVSADVEHRVQEQVPAATTFETLWDWSTTPAGRLLMVDREAVLVGVFDGKEADGRQLETAIWGRGETNGLVVVLRAMFTWQLDAEE